MIAALLLAVLPAQAPDPVFFESARFLAQDGEVYSLSSGEAVPGGVPGTLMADFDFQLAGGPPALAALWRVTGRNSEYLCHYVDEGWKGLRGESGPYVRVLTYDPTTGIGSAVLSLPVGRAYSLEQRLPLLPEEACRIDVVIGREGGLDLDFGGQPTGGLWEGAILPFVVYPDVWVDVCSPTIGPGGNTLATLYSREDHTAPRTYVLEVENPGVVHFGPRPGVHPGADRFPSLLDSSPLPGGRVLLQLPADAIGFHFGLEADGTGEYRVLVRDEGGVGKGCSATAWSVPGGSALRLEQVLDADGDVLVSDATLASMSATGGTLETVDSKLDTSLINRKCKKAECQGYLVGIFSTICGECSLHPDVPDHCDDRYGLYYHSLAECKYVLNLNSGCVFDSWVILQCKLYRIDRDYELTSNGCPEVSAGTGLFDFFFGTRVQTYRYCCIRKQDDSAVKLVQVKQCKDV